MFLIRDLVVKAREQAHELETIAASLRKNSAVKFHADLVRAKVF